MTSRYELAHQWRDDQPQAANAAATIAQQVQDRYGIDMTSSDQLRAVLARAEIDLATRIHPAAPVEQADDLATAPAVVVRADQRDDILEVAAGETVTRD